MKIKLKCFLFSGLMSACSTTSKEVNLNSSELSEVFSLDLQNTDSQWQRVGETPLSLNLEENSLKLYRIQSKEKKEQFVLMPSGIPEGELNIDFSNLISSSSEEPESEKKEEIKIEAINDAIISTLRAYAALWEKKPEAAKQLADQAEQLNASLVGPPLIQALALIMENNISEAQAKLEVAKSRKIGNLSLIKEIESKISQ